MGKNGISVRLEHHRIPSSRFPRQVTWVNDPPDDVLGQPSQPFPAVVLVNPNRPPGLQLDVLGHIECQSVMDSGAMRGGDHFTNMGYSRWNNVCQ